MRYCILVDMVFSQKRVGAFFGSRFTHSFNTVNPSFELDQLHATNQDLFALLSALTGQDEHADAFMARLLSLNDYAFFCEQMRLTTASELGDDLVW